MKDFTVEEILVGTGRSLPERNTEEHLLKRSKDKGTTWKYKA